MEKRRNRDRLLPLFLAAEGALYAGFLLLDLFGPPGAGDGLKYGSIVLCLLLALTARTGTEGRFIAAALVFTLLADAFLLLLDAWYGAGVGCFCVVQVLYLVRIRRAGGWPRTVCAAVRLCALGGGLLLLAGLGVLSPLTGLAAGYFTQLVCNALESLTLLRQGKRYVLFSAGLFLFLGCDVCVGLHNLPGLLPVDPRAGMFAFAAVGMWLFYLPSQVLIALSGRVFSTE